MQLWNFIEMYLFPLFGEITPYALERVRDMFWIVLGVIIVHCLVYLPYKALMCLIHKTHWKGRWML